MIADLLYAVAIFFVVAFGVAWPWVARMPLTPAEKLATSTALSLLGAFVLGWIVYLVAAPLAVFWLLPALGLAGLVAGRRSLPELWQDRAARTLLVTHAVFTAWCIGWLGTIASYSGGGWVADWYEHWERARFFLQHQSLETRFLGRYPLTARPPLANVVNGAFLALTKIDFAHYQVFSTLMSALVFLPTGLLVLRWSGRRNLWVLTLALMLSPLVVENVTFAWTKLPAAAFVLTAFYFFLKARSKPESIRRLLLCSVFLAAGMLAHYSAGPYLVAIAAGWLAVGWQQRTSPIWWRNTGLAILCGGGVLALWFAWSLTTLGAYDTFLTNPSVTSSDAQHGNQLLKIGANLSDTIVPHFLRPLDGLLIAQRSLWGAWRDWFFQCYQVNLLFAFGSVTWIALGRELIAYAKTVTAIERRLGAGLIVGVIVLGVGVHGQRDHWGLAHICLQALVILGLGFLTSRWFLLPRGWRIALGVGAAFDFLAGIALHFGVQSFVLDRWFASGRSPQDTLTSYSEAALMNLTAKITHQLAFFSDVDGLSIYAWLAVLAAIFVFTAAMFLGNANTE
jgi:hypothetical protein